MNEFLYQNELCTISFAQKPLTKGHLILKPTQTFAKIDDISPELFSQYCEYANACSGLLFEELSATGTNIIITEAENNSENCVIFEIIARTEDDGISFMWKPKQITQGDFAQIANQISSHIIIGEQYPNKPQEHKQQKEKSQDVSSNFLYQELHRIP